MSLIFLNVEFFKELDYFVCDINKLKLWMNKQEKKKEILTHSDNEINEQVDFTDNKRGLHQQPYHNQAKIYQSEHFELNDKEALNLVIAKIINLYKNTIFY